MGFELHSLWVMLVDQHPLDVLMPVEKGTKRPMFGHKGGKWTWVDFAKFTRAHRDMRAFDLCIVLHDICVIDIDDERLAADLVRRFPELDETTMVRTARGRHYYFLRTAEADEHGYYDGAGQRTHGIDFKSVCRTGTGGVIMVPPSCGKLWERNGLASLQPISLKLLDAVAVPQHKVIDMTLVFEDRERMHIAGCRWLHSMAYFEPYFDDFEHVAEVPVPVSKAPFTDLLFLLDNQSLGAPVITREMLSDIGAVADKLGLQSYGALKSRLNHGVPRFQVDLCEYHPVWWSTFAAEIRRESQLVSVDDELAAELKYIPLTRDERWLFQGIRPRKRAHGPDVLHADPVNALMDACPDEILELMWLFPGKLVLAGGAVAGAVVRHTKPGHDFDMYVVGSESDADAILTAAKQLLNVGQTTHTGNAITMLVDDTVVQFVLRLYDDPVHVIEFFDIPPCKVMAYYEAAQGAQADQTTLVIKATQTWVECVRHMAFPVDLSCWGEASAARVLKYVTKGFDAMVPGVRRAALRDQFATVDANGGVMELFAIEHRIGVSRKRPTFDEIMKQLRGRQTSDYGAAVKFQRRLYYILATYVKKGIALTGLDRFFGTQPSPPVWTRCDPGSRRRNVFRPANPKIASGFDTDKLTVLLTENAPRA